MNYRTLLLAVIVVRGIVSTIQSWRAAETASEKDQRRMLFTQLAGLAFVLLRPGRKRR